MKLILIECFIKVIGAFKITFPLKESTNNCTDCPVLYSNFGIGSITKLTVKLNREENPEEKKVFFQTEIVPTNVFISKLQTYCGLCLNRITRGIVFLKEKEIRTVKVAGNEQVFLFCEDEKISIFENKFTKAWYFYTAVKVDSEIILGRMRIGNDDNSIKKKNKRIELKINKVDCVFEYFLNESNQNLLIAVPETRTIPLSRLNFGEMIKCSKDAEVGIKNTLTKLYSNTSEISVAEQPTTVTPLKPKEVIKIEEKKNRVNQNYKKTEAKALVLSYVFLTLIFFALFIIKLDLSSRFSAAIRNYKEQACNNYKNDLFNIDS